MAGGGEGSFIQPLGLLLGSTALVALLFSYAKQSTIVAFIAVGVAVSSFGVEVETTTLGHISEIGILILLFMAGLEVELESFIKKWKTVTIIGVGQIVCTTGFFALTSLLVLPAIGVEDVTAPAAVYFGLCMCFSSTILVLGYLKNTKSMGTVYGQLCLGTLVLQDAASVLGIAALDGLSSGGSDIGISILILFGKLLAACFICFLLERYVLHKMFEAFARSLELLYLGSLGYATGLAAIAVTAGFSGEITAFLAGVSIAQLPYKMHIETKMEPIKSLGVAIFFISLGLGLEVNQQFVESLPIGIGLAVFTLFSTLPLFMGLGVLAGLKAHNVFMLGLLMNQISEFSLILCTLTVRAGVFEPIVLTVMTVAAVFSIIISSIGHTFIDAIYQKMQRWPILLCIDARYRRRLQKQHGKDNHNATDLEEGDSDITEMENSSPKSIEEPGIDDKNPTGKKTHKRAPSLQRQRPSGLADVEDWAFEDQLANRSTEQLEIDLKETEKELERARDSMAATANEKRLHFEKTKKQLYGDEAPKAVATKGGGGGNSRVSIIETSHATDIMHGMIEGYVIIDHQMMFCTLRTGRMLFWRDQHDVGQAPPTSVWDISGMAILKTETKDETTRRASSAKEMRKIAEESGDGKDNESFLFVDPDDEDSSSDEGDSQWEWTIVLGHIHRHTGTASIEDDTMKLAIHGLEDYSDHDAQDWQDALAVATAMLNPIALRLAHIREELDCRRTVHPLKGGGGGALGDDRKVRDKIICIGYNEMFPAVLALADAIRKDVVVVEYDPMKINTVNKLYNEEKRKQEYTDRKSVKNKNLKAIIRPHSTDDLKAINRPRSTDDLKGLGGEEGGDIEQGGIRNTGRSRRLMKTMSTPMYRMRSNSSSAAKNQHQGFWGSPATTRNSFDLDDNKTDASTTNSDKVETTTMARVDCKYADIHDPESWEELEMDKAFMLVCTMKGARHAEKALIKWLKKHESDTIFVACTQNNVEAIQLYKAGAHFVMQTDALAMRSTREIFMESVANVGDCSQLVVAGQAHRKRLLKLENENKLKFRYETG